MAVDSLRETRRYARRTFDLRLPRADLVIWLDTPRLTCLARVILRGLMNRPRPDLPCGCREKLDKAFLGFLKFVWQFDHGYHRPAVAHRVPPVRAASAAMQATRSWHPLCG